MSRDDPNALDLVTKEYVLHPDFDPVTLENDVGLIKLQQTVTFTGKHTTRKSIFKNFLFFRFRLHQAFEFDE